MTTHTGVDTVRSERSCASPRRVRVLELAGPAARAVRARPDGHIAAIHRSTLTVRCAGMLVNLAETPVALACSARVASGTLTVLAGLPVGSPVHLSAAGAPERSMRLTAGGLPRVVPATDRAVVASWFDSAQGRRFGRPRLTAAARALAGNAGADALLALCGLGVGLTPSGDDALVGMLAVAQCAGRAAESRAEFAARLDDSLSTEVSLGYLRLALGGEFSIPVLHLMDALTGPVGPDSVPGAPIRSDDALARAVHEVSRIGHSSGADLLAGVSALRDVLVDRKETA